MGNCDGLLAEQILYNIDVSIKKPSFLDGSFYKYSIGISHRMYVMRLFYVCLFHTDCRHRKLSVYLSLYLPSSVRTS